MCECFKGLGYRDPNMDAASFTFKCSGIDSKPGRNTDAKDRKGKDSGKILGHERRLESSSILFLYLY